MEKIREKYANFVAFIQENIKDSSYLSMLSTVSVETFLEKLKGEKGRSAQEIARNICSKCNIDITTYPVEVYNKFVRYIEYFQRITQVI